MNALFLAVEFNTNRKTLSGFPADDFQKLHLFVSFRTSQIIFRTSACSLISQVERTSASPLCFFECMSTNLLFF